MPMPVAAFVGAGSECPVQTVEVDSAQCWLTDDLHPPPTIFYSYPEISFAKLEAAEEMCTTTTTEVSAGTSGSVSLH